MKSVQGRVKTYYLPGVFAVNSDAPAQRAIVLEYDYTEFDGEESVVVVPRWENGSIAQLDEFGDQLAQQIAINHARLSV